MLWNWLSEMFLGYVLMKDNNTRKVDDDEDEKTPEKDPYDDDEPLDPDISEEERFEKRYKYTFGKKNK